MSASPPAGAMAHTVSRIGDVMSIYVRDAAGNRTKIAGVGLPGPAGKSAYQYAVEGGFSGTEEEFRAVVGMRSNDSLLDNANFRYPINQRGKTEYTADGYCIDRWKNILCKCTLQPGGIKLTKTSGVDYASFQQFLPRTFDENDNTVHTLSALIGGELFVGTGKGYGLDATAVGTRNFVRIYEGKNVEFVLFDDTPILQAAKLELGPVQTLAHKDASGNWVLNDPPPDPALELAKCQRYQFVINPQQLYAKFGIAVSHDIDMVFADVALPVPLRALPAIQVTNVNNIRFIRCGPMEAQIPITNVSLNSIIGNIIYLNIEVHGISLGDYGFMDFSSTDARIVLDANL